MRSFPGSLLALLLPLSAISVPSSTPNDPFHEIAVRVAKKDDPPVCCLRPLTPTEGTADEDVLLSFEEWKAKQMASVLKEQAVPVHTPAVPGQQQHPASIGAENLTEPSLQVPMSGALPSFEQSEAQAADAPYFRIPITDRFNYASTDCSARVHTAHKSAKSTSSILNSKKDRYMLSPCAEERQFVVVELCDDIRIDTVQLANYEFFSGVFKDFSVRVAKTYTTDPEGWVFAGAYRAQNVRGVQSFHPPTTVADFYRFIRIDFHSHYGNEFYCPLSLLRVYGLTHLEHWKWDLWESESRQRRAELPVPYEAMQELPQPTEWPEWTSNTVASEHSATTMNQESVSGLPGEVDNRTEMARSPSAMLPSRSDVITVYTTLGTVPSPILPDNNDQIPPVTPVASYTSQRIIISDAPIIETATSDTSSPSSPHNAPSSQATNLSSDTIHDPPRQHTPDSLYNNAHPAVPSSSTSVSLSLSVAAQPVLAQQSASSHHQHGSPIPSSSSFSSPSHSGSVSSPILVNHSSQNLPRMSSSSSTVTTTSHSLSVVSAAPPSSGGESIYRTIMNRLTALETNTSLYARFVEDHTANVREMLRKLGEEVGRLEGLGKAQAQMYQRSVVQFERQQHRLEVEHAELMSRVSRLTDEVVLEKRLGIAQLCLLLAVLVFMALTRGSRSEPVRSTSLRGWGRRTLSLSGDWVNRIRGRSTSPESIRESETIISLDGDKPQDLKLKVAFPSQGVQAGEGFPRSKRPHPITGRKLGSSRPRTPVSTRSPFNRHASPSTPTASGLATAPLLRAAPRPAIQRAHSSALSQSFSTGMIPPGPKSAKHWARSAHLHEVKTASKSTPSSSTTSLIPSTTPSRSAAASGSVGASTSLDAAAEILRRRRPSDRFAQSEGENVKPNGDNEDVFGPQEEPVKSPARTSSSVGPVQRRISADSPRRDSPVRLPLRGDMPRGCSWGSRTSTSEADASEGDAWIDTDADDSESELGFRRRSVGSLS